MAGFIGKAVRLVKLGAVAGLAVGVGRWVMQRRRRPETSESSWPTIAETAARDGQPVDGAGEERGDSAADAEDAPDAAQSDDSADEDSSDEDSANGDAGAGNGDSADKTS